MWTEDYLDYDFGDHPLNPVRLELTIRLARELGVLDRLDVVAPTAADDDQLLTVHSAAYLDAVREASTDPTFSGYGLGTTDDPGTRITASPDDYWSRLAWVRLP